MKSYLTAVVMLTCLVGASASADAQDGDAVVVDVLFDFVAGRATLPAGQYKISRVNPSLNQELSISSYNKGNAFVLPQTFTEGSPAQPRLNFEYVGGKHFLTEIRTLGGVYTLTAPREMIMLGQASTPSVSASSSAGGR
jgi:hypothetical protein